MADRVLLVGVVTPVSSRKVIEEHLAELQLLVKTLDYEVADQFIVNRKIFDPATYIGKGKIEEIKSLVTLHDIQDVIFDDDISPTQARNIARIIDREVVDRSGIIIEIFAKHARTKEARTWSARRDCRPGNCSTVPAIEPSWTKPSASGWAS